MITKLDFVGIPSQDAERARAFYGETLGLRARREVRLRVLGRRDLLRHLGAGEAGHAVRAAAQRPPALHVDDVAAARAELEAKGVEFLGDTFDTGVCHMALFRDPDGNDLMLHHRYAPRGLTTAALARP